MSPNQSLPFRQAQGPELAEGQPTTSARRGERLYNFSDRDFYPLPGFDGVCTEHGGPQKPLGDTAAWTLYALKSGLRGTVLLKSKHGVRIAGLHER